MENQEIEFVYIISIAGLSFFIGGLIFIVKAHGKYRIRKIAKNEELIEQLIKNRNV